jgi:hypothetical protein
VRTRLASQPVGTLRSVTRAALFIPYGRSRRGLCLSVETFCKQGDGGSARGVNGGKAIKAMVG